MAEGTTLHDLVRRARNLLDDGDHRVMLGITGPPGAGKSTVAQAIVDGIGPADAVVVPMDGFHLRRAEIAGTPLMDRRGAPDTFDAEAFHEALRRIRHGIPEDMAIPAFDHLAGDPVA